MKPSNRDLANSCANLDWRRGCTSRMWLPSLMKVYKESLQIILAERTHIAFTRKQRLRCAISWSCEAAASREWEERGETITHNKGAYASSGPRRQHLRSKRDHLRGKSSALKLFDYDMLSSKKPTRSTWLASA